MKKFNYLMAAAIILFAGCAKENLNQKVEGAEGLVKIKVNMNLEGTNDESKLALGDDFKSLIWNTADEIGVVPVIQTYKAIDKVITNQGGNVFEGEVEASTTGYHLVYPVNKGRTNKKGYDDPEKAKKEQRLFDIPFACQQIAVKDGLPLISNSYDPVMNGKPAVVLVGQTDAAQGTEFNATMNCVNSFLKFKIKDGGKYKELHITITSPMIAADRVYYTLAGYSAKAPFTLFSEDGFCESTTLVVRPQGATFDAGTYYASMIPTSYKGITIRLVDVDGKTRAKSKNLDSGVFDFSAGSIKSLGGDLAIDEICKPSDMKTYADYDVTFDFTAAETFTESPKAVTDFSTSQNSVTYKTKLDTKTATASHASTTSFSCTIKGSKGFGMAVLPGAPAESQKYLKFAANSSGASAYISAPAFSGYTVKSIDVEFAQEPEGVSMWVGKGGNSFCMTKDDTPVAVSGTTATVYTAHVNPYCAYYCLFGDGDLSKATLKTQDVYVKKITFHYVPGSWNGSWE